VFALILGNHSNSFLIQALQGEISPVDYLFFPKEFYPNLTLNRDSLKIKETPSFY